MVEITQNDIFANEGTTAQGDDLLKMFNCMLNIKNALVISGYANHYSEQTISALLDRIESDLLSQGSATTHETVFRTGL